MKKKGRGSRIFGMGLMMVGGIMLLGVLGMGWLIPVLIAGFFIMTGWRLIKGNPAESGMEMNTEMHMSVPYHHSPELRRDFDELDQWEKAVKNKN
jgi:hypothetical protein